MTDFVIKGPEGSRVISSNHYPLVSSDKLELQRADPFAWQWLDGNPRRPLDSHFRLLETHQIEYNDDLPQTLTVFCQSARQPEKLRLYVADRHTGEPGMPHDAENDGGSYLFRDLAALWSVSDVQHATLIAYHRDAGETGAAATAIWLNKGFRDNEGLDWIQEAASPRWSTEQLEDRLYLIYAADLYYRLNTEEGTGKPMRIHVAGDSSVPISSQYLAFEVNDKADYHRAEKFAASQGSSEGGFQVMYRGSANAASSRPIEIVGNGRIDGSSLRLLPDYSAHHFTRPPMGRPFSLDDVCGEYRDGKGKLQQARFRDSLTYLVDSNLVSLASGSRHSPAIRLEGLTIANAPVRHQSAVNLNVVTTPMASLEQLVKGKIEPEANNRPVHVRDLKIAGNWIGAADGIEVGGDGSTIDTTYQHVADDTIKLHARNVSYRNTTVLQGDIGGVINIGSYGFNRGVSGTVVDGVYVHRVTQKVWHTAHGDIAQDDDRGGLITSRTGCFNFRGQGENGLFGVIISRFYVARILSADEDVNSVSRPIALGLIGGNETTRNVFVRRFPTATPFLFGDIRISSLRIDVDPHAPSLFYKDPPANCRVVMPGSEEQDLPIRVNFVKTGTGSYTSQDAHGRYDIIGLVDVSE